MANETIGSGTRFSGGPMTAKAPVSGKGSPLAHAILGMFSSEPSESYVKVPASDIIQLRNIALEETK